MTTARESNCLIIVPAFNEEKVLAETLQRLLQFVDAHQVLVVDDGSTDATFALAKTAGVRVAKLPFNLGIGGAEAIAVNDKRFVVGVPIEQTQAGVTISGLLVPAPWTITAIGDANRLAQAADLMTQSLRADRRVRQATYRVEADVVIRAVVSERPFVYGVAS